MKLDVTIDYEYPDTRKWLLKNGQRLEGEIVWFGPTHESVISGEIEEGVHVDLMDAHETEGYECLCNNLGVFRTLDEGLQAVYEHFTSGTSDLTGISGMPSPLQ